MRAANLKSRSAGKARAVQMYFAFRDREKFRQEKNDYRGGIPKDK
jgi:hypothetical protein